MKKLNLIILMLLISIVSVSATCEPESFTERILSDCKLDDGICNDGENLLFDEDCPLNFSEMYTGKIFKHMWLLRALICVSIIMLIKNNESTPVWVLSVVVLMVFNGAFMTNDVIQDPEIVSNEPTTCTLSKLGHCILPSYPLAGWGIIIFVSLFLLKFVWKYISQNRNVYK